MGYFTGTFRSQALDMDTHIGYIFPEGTDHALNPPKATLLLLHGKQSSYDAWARCTNIERYANAHQIAVIMPEVQRSFYVDMAYGLKYYTYIAEELPEVVHKIFGLDVSPDKLWIGGLSMGAYGSMKAILNNPTRFSGCIALSGRYFLKRKASLMEKDSFDWKEMQGILGMDLVPGPKDDFDALVEALKTEKPQHFPKLYMAVGDNDYLHDDNIKLSGMMKSLDLSSFKFEEWPGIHNWDFWDEGIRRGLNFLDPPAGK